jgi:hypothetical protein
VPVSIALPYPFVVRCGWRGVREDGGVWNSFTTIPNLTNLIVRTDRRLLAGIEGRRASGLSDKDYLTLVRYIYWWGQAVGRLEDEMLCGFDSRCRHWNFTWL